MTRVLLTGATGFIGRHAAASLREHGLEVHPVSRSEGVDLLEPRAADAVVARVRPTHLLHLAWYAEHGSFWTSSENVRWVEASLRLVRAFAEGGGRRAVLAGTGAEYDWSHGRLDERATPLRPATLYGAAKHGLHVVAQAYADTVGLSLAWGRVHFLYGPGEDPRRLVPSIAIGLAAGEEARASHGRQIRDFAHVRDVADGFTALLASDVRGPVNVASGEGVAIADVVRSLARAAGREDLVRLGAVPARPDDPPELVADVARLRDEVGFRPSRALDDGLAETFAWWRAREGGVRR